MSATVQFRIFVPPGTQAKSAARAVFKKGLTGKVDHVQFSLGEVSGWRALRVILTAEDFDVIAKPTSQPNQESAMNDVCATLAVVAKSGEAT